MSGSVYSSGNYVGATSSRSGGYQAPASTATAPAVSGTTTQPGEPTLPGASPAPSTVSYQDILSDQAAVSYAQSSLSLIMANRVNDGGTALAAAESAYNAASNKELADLSARLGFLNWAVGPASYDRNAPPGQTTIHAQPAVSMSYAEMQADLAEIGNDSAAISSATNWASTPRDPFVGTGVTPFTGAGMVSTASYGPGSQYESAPSIAPGADLGQVIQNMSPAQASWLGWGMAQMAQQKQVSVPPQDAQAWSALAGYELEHNPYFNGTAPIQMSKGQLQRTAGTPNQFSIASEFVTASPGDVGQTISAILGGVGAVAGMALMGVGDAADAAALGETAAEAAAAGGGEAASEAGGAAAATAETGATGGAETAEEIAAEEASPFGNSAYVQDASAQPNLPSDAPAGTTWTSSGDRPLFGAQGPTPEDASQGELGDCWFASALQNMAQRDPQAIVNNIVKTGSDTYKVGFYDSSGNKVWVAIDDTLPQVGGNQSLMGDSTGPTWAALYEKAAAKFYSFSDRSGGNGYDVLDAGTGPRATRALIGPNPTPDRCYYELDQGQWVADDGTQQLPFNPVDMQNSLTKWTNDKNPNALAFAAFRYDASDTAGMGGHEYSVSGYDPATQTITLRNPWGNNNGLLPGMQETLNGADITMPLDQFLKVGGILSIN